MKEAGLSSEDQQLSILSSVQEATAYLAAEMDEKELQKAGVQIDEFFVGCAYNGLKCSLNEMKSFTDKRYGNCFTFNWDGSYYVQRHGQNMGKGIFHYWALGLRACKGFQRD